MTLNRNLNLFSRKATAVNRLNLSMRRGLAVTPYADAPLMHGVDGCHARLYGYVL